MKVLTALHFLIAHIAADPLRSLLTVGGLAVVSCAYLLIAALSHGLTIFGSSMLTVPQTLILMERDITFPSDSYLSTATLDTAAGALTRKFGAQALQRTAPMIIRSLHYQNRTYQLAAMKLDDFTTLAYLVLREGEWPVAERQVVVSPSFLSLSGLRLGDLIHIYGSDFLITGVVTSERWNAAIVYMTYTTAQHLFRASESFQMGLLLLAPEVNVTTARQLLMEDPILSVCCNVYMDDQLLATFQGMLTRLRWLASLFQFLALLVVTFGSFNAANLTLEEFSRERVLLRVVGFDSRAVAGLLLGRMLLLVLPAYLLACAGAAWLTTGLPMISLHSVAVPVQLNAGISLTGAALVVLFVSMGIWLAMRSTSRLSVAEALSAASMARGV
jgi:hypothetical protein